MSSYLARRSVQGFDDKPIIYYSVSMSVARLMQDLYLSREANIKSPDGRDKDILSEMMNRNVDSKRAEPIAKYLLTDEERFIPTIIVACHGGNPKFTSLKLDVSDEVTKGVVDFNNDITEEDLSNFGILSLSKKQKYFILDGQHRLLGLSHIQGHPRATEEFSLDPKTINQYPDQREDILNDEINVIFIENLLTGDEKKDYKNFIKRTRKLFTVLNKHQKPTKKSTNIALDEEDLAAVITRGLIEKQDTVGGLFYWDGLDEKSMNVDIESSGNLRQGSHYLTSLVTLHLINKAIIQIMFDWGKNDFDNLEKIHDNSKTNQPNYDNKLITEAVINIWDVLIDTFKVWSKKDPEKMKHHIKPEERKGDIEDNMLFWPIGQIGVAKYLATKTVELSKTKYEYSINTMKKAAKGLNKVKFDFFDAPWKGYMIHETPDMDSLIENKRNGTPVETNWKIRTKDDDRILDTLRFLASDNYSDPKMTAVWKDSWASELKLYENDSEKDIKKMWDSTLKQRKTFTEAKKN